MARTIFGNLFGGIVGGIVLYLVGFLFWGTPLSGLAYGSLDAAQSASLRAALAQTLTVTGTGTYLVPNPATDQGTTLFGMGPVATVHFNTAGFPLIDTAALLTGLVLAIVAGILIAAALRIVGTRVFEFGERAKVAILFALAITLYIDIGGAVMNHYGLGHFVYAFIGDFLGFAACGLVIARWFLPNAVVVADPVAAPFPDDETRL